MNTISISALMDVAMGRLPNETAEQTARRMQGIAGAALVKIHAVKADPVAPHPAATDLAETLDDILDDAVSFIADIALCPEGHSPESMLQNALEFATRSRAAWAKKGGAA